MKSKKTIVLFLCAVVACVSAIFAGTIINRTELPEAATQFITKYFPNDEIRKIEKDYDHNKVEYDVDFESGAEVEFRSDGQWKDVKAAYGNAVPSGIVPAGIAEYVAQNYKGMLIIEISRERSSFEVELSNGIELKLTQDGKPLQGYKGKGKR